jgi:hypothetical protein
VTASTRLQTGAGIGFPQERRFRRRPPVRIATGCHARPTRSFKAGFSQGVVKKQHFVILCHYFARGGFFFRISPWEELSRHHAWIDRVVLIASGESGASRSGRRCEKLSSRSVDLASPGPIARADA